MAGKGTYTAYQQQYSQGPKDVAGDFATGLENIAQAKLDKDKEIKEEAEKKKKDQEDLYTQGTGNILDTTGLPPEASDIAVIAGDKIHDLVTNSGLTGIELKKAIDIVVKDANSAISSIQTSAESKLSQPKDDFFVDGKFGSQSDSMMNGDYVFQYDGSGRGVWVNKNDPTDIRRTGDFNSDQAGENSIGQILITGDGSLTELMNGKKSANSWSLKTEAGQTAYKNALGRELDGLFNPDDALPGIRFMYNNANKLGISPEEKAALLEIGKKLHTGGKLEGDDLALFEKYAQGAKDHIMTQMTQDFQTPTKTTQTNDPNNPVVTQKSDNRTYVSDGTARLKKLRGGKFGPKKVSYEVATQVIEGFSGAGGGISRLVKVDNLLSSTEALKDKDGNPLKINGKIVTGKDAAHFAGITKISYDDRGPKGKQEGTGKGTIHLKGGEEIRFESWEELKSKTNELVRKGLLNELGITEEDIEFVQKYSNPVNYLVGDNTQQMVNDLSIGYDGQGVTFEVGTGQIEGQIVVKLGAQAAVLPIAGVSPETRALMVTNAIAKLKSK